MASVLATISEMLIMGAASLKVIFDVVTAYHSEHNFQVRKGDIITGSRLFLLRSQGYMGIAEIQTTSQK